MNQRVLTVLATVSYGLVAEASVTICDFAATSQERAPAEAVRIAVASVGSESASTMARSPAVRLSCGPGPRADQIVDKRIPHGPAIRSEEPASQSLHQFYELAAAEPKVTMTAIQTVGVKGHDGFAVALVTGSP